VWRSAFECLGLRVYLASHARGWISFAVAMGLPRPFVLQRFLGSERETVPRSRLRRNALASMKIIESDIYRYSLHEEEAARSLVTGGRSPTKFLLGRHFSAKLRPYATRPTRSGTTP